MKKNILFSLLFFAGILVRAQSIYDGIPKDSVVFTLEASDSLQHTMAGTKITLDTTNTHVWIIGKTHKPFFSAGGDDTTFAIMTDTVGPYPINANDAFILKIQHMPINCIVDFHHKYQCFPGTHGGIVEFSLDSGTTWQNVKGPCNEDSTILGQGVHTENFYSKTDTLRSGDMAFSGVAPIWQTSRIQFFQAIPLRTTKGTSSCSFAPGSTLYVRFRFVSDTLPSPMDGWIIDDIKVEGDDYPSFIPIAGTYHNLNISPNPSLTGFFTFPVLNNEKNTELEITNAVGQILLRTSYTHRVDLSQYPKGLYLYKVVNSNEYYSGRLIVQ